MSWAGRRKRQSQTNHTTDSQAGQSGSRRVSAQSLALFPHSITPPTRWKVVRKNKTERLSSSLLQTHRSRGSTHTQTADRRLIFTAVSAADTKLWRAVWLWNTQSQHVIHQLRGHEDTFTAAGTSAWRSLGSNQTCSLKKVFSVILVLRLWDADKKQLLVNSGSFTVTVPVQETNKQTLMTCWCSLDAPVSESEHVATKRLLSSSCS